MLYLTYNTNIWNDGMGAQYQRIIGIICISYYYNFTYVHTPLLQMEHVNKEYINTIDSFFQISNNYPNVNSITYDQIIEEENPSIDFLNQYNNSNKKILIKIYLPFNICDNNPSIYKNNMYKFRNLIINKNLPFYNNNNTKIAIHLRRGDVQSDSNSERYTSINDIINIIHIFKNKYPNSTFYIFTEINDNNKNEFDVFNNDPTINIKANEDVILTFNHLINADVLVICKSSFSYLAGLYNKNIVYYFDFWHSPLSNWINIKDLQNNEHYTDLPKINNFNFNYLIFFIIILSVSLSNIKNKYLIIMIIIMVMITTYISTIETMNSDISSKYTAVIIEPRKHKALEFVLTNFTNMLDNRWNFIIFHGNDNIDYINDIINTKLSNQSNRIKLINLNVNNLSIHDYNTLLYNPQFYSNIPTEIFLIFQTDTMICSTFKNNIYKFIDNDYDYVGAPYPNKTVGNGGLSLRKKSKMLEIINKCSDRKQFSDNQLHNEDAFFSNVCADRVNIKLPSFEDAQKFAIETVYSNESFGIHKAWSYNDSSQIENINKYCPNLYSLINLHN
jgi:hypothetical protein